MRRPLVLSVIAVALIGIPGYGNFPSGSLVSHGCARTPSGAWHRKAEPTVTIGSGQFP